MHSLRTVIHLCFDAATAALYIGSLAIVLGAAVIVYTQTIAPGLATALISFLIIAAAYGYRLYRAYRPRLWFSSPVSA